MKPEFEIYELTCNTIRKRLKSIVKGYVRVGVDYDDNLTIYIEDDGFKFNYVTHNYLNVVLNNGTDGIIEDVSNQYRKAILAKYFY